MTSDNLLLDYMTSAWLALPYVDILTLILPAMLRDLRGGLSLLSWRMYGSASSANLGTQPMQR